MGLEIRDCYCDMNRSYFYDFLSANQKSISKNVFPLFFRESKKSYFCRMKRWVKQLSFLLLLLFLSCTSFPEKPHRGGSLTYFRNHPGEGLDPIHIKFDNATREVAGLIFEGLVGLKPKTFQLTPLLAESWHYSKDHLKLTFQLRKNIRFQNDVCFPKGEGRRVTANDFRYSFERLILSGKSRWIFSTFSSIRGFQDFASRRTAHLKGIRIPSPLKLVVLFNHPDYDFLFKMTTSHGYVVPKEAIEKYGEAFDFHPVGTGPFRLANWDQNGELLLVHNENYWEHDSLGTQLPYLNEIHIINNSVAKTPSNLEGMDENHYDVYFEVNPKILDSVKKELKESKYKNRYKLFRSNIALTAFDVFNFRKDGIFQKDKSLRKALVHFLLKKKLMLGKKWQGHRPIMGLLPPDFPGVDTTASQFVPDSLSLHNLLKKKERNKKYSPLFCNSFIYSLTIDDTPTVISRLKKEGILLRYSIEPAKADLLYFYWLAFYPDPQTFLELFYSGADMLGIGYQNTRYDSLYEVLDKTFDPGKRKQIGNRLQHILVDDAVAAFLFQEWNYYVFRSDLVNFEQCINPYRIRYFKYVWRR